MLMPQSGSGLGFVKSLRVAVGDWEERVSAMNVVIQGIPEGNTALRSKPPSINSPAAKLVLPDLSVKGHGDVAGAPLTSTLAGTWRKAHQLEAPRGIVPHPLVYSWCGNTPANGEISNHQDVAVLVHPTEVKPTPSLCSGEAHMRILEEPESHGGVAAVVEPVHTEVHDQMAWCLTYTRTAPGRKIISSRIGMGNIVLALRLACCIQPGALLDTICVLRAACLEDVVRI